MSDAHHCPLCGTENACAMAADPQAASCWCFDAKVDPAALARVPEEARGKTCLCRGCATVPPQALTRSR